MLVALVADSPEDVVLLGVCRWISFAWSGGDCCKSYELSQFKGVIFKETLDFVGNRPLFEQKPFL